ITEAAQRIAAARAAISTTSPQSALVNLLAADVEIRQLNFDRGRSLLESVVRLGSADEDARGRAQWMIGETYYMQERFGEAIDAYRLVEGISGEGQWTAAALVQAGKSFEQLGRTREAAVCYSTLVRRFANSQHATGARRRLAALSPDASSESPLRR
ncbi:tetratricopeptide repeat protein, partial [Rhodopirellula bahusiensis]